MTGGVGKNHVWANGTLLCTVQNDNYNYYHTDHLGTSKLQTDGQGKVVSIDITKPYGPVAREGVMADTFSDLSKIDPDKSRFQYDAATGTILPPVRGRGLPKQITDNHEVTVEKTAYERVKNARIIQTASDQVNTELKVEFDFIGKARLTVKNKAGDIVFQDEYSGTELKTKTIRVEVGYTLNQAYTVVLELAARNASTPARSTIFSVSWGEAEADYGFVRSLPQTFNIDIYSVRLSCAGTGVIFYLNTGGKLWQKIEPGQETLLDQPGRTLTIRAYLTMVAETNLQSYGLEINPYHDMSFTGKFLEPEIGLVYFGGRWYEPGIGRWVTVDPAEDGGNWYGYCWNNPVDSFDPDGFRVWFVHGTNNNNTVWTNRFPDLVNRIATFFSDSGDTTFNWGINNNDHRSRATAARRLAQQIRAWRNTHPNDPIRLVGHSHGGNVCILAANILGDPRLGTPIQIDNLITVATPVRPDYQSVNNNVKIHNHIYSMRDFVQVNGGSDNNDSLWPNWARKWPTRNIVLGKMPKAANGQIGEWGRAGRTFALQNGVNNIRVITPGNLEGWPDETVAHSIMLSNINIWINQVEPNLWR